MRLLIGREGDGGSTVNFSARKAFSIEIEIVKSFWFDSFQLIIGEAKIV